MAGEQPALAKQRETMEARKGNSKEVGARRRFEARPETVTRAAGRVHGEAVEPRLGPPRRASRADMLLIAALFDPFGKLDVGTSSTRLAARG